MKLYESMLCIRCREVFDRKTYFKMKERCPKCTSAVVKPIDTWLGVLAFQKGQVVVKRQGDRSMARVKPSPAETHPKGISFEASRLRKYIFPLSLERMAD